MDVPQVRQLVIRAVEDKKLAPAGLVGEMVLVRDGFYVGRRFVFEGLEAVWMLDSNLVLLETDAGASLPPFDLSHLQSRRPAA